MRASRSSGRALPSGADTATGHEPARTAPAAQHIWPEAASRPPNRPVPWMTSPTPRSRHASWSGPRRDFAVGDAPLPAPAPGPAAPVRLACPTPGLGPCPLVGTPGSGCTVVTSRRPGKPGMTPLARTALLDLTGGLVEDHPVLPVCSVMRGAARWESDTVPPGGRDGPLQAGAVLQLVATPCSSVTSCPCRVLPSSSEARGRSNVTPPPRRAGNDVTFSVPDEGSAR